MPDKEERIRNLRKANEESHQVIVDSLRTALYELLKTREIGEIKVVDLIRKAGVSRGAFYKNYYLITDVLKDDIRSVTDDVGNAIGGNISVNWEVILRAAYQHRNKIPMLLKAGMGMEILEQMNAAIAEEEERFRLRIMTWNGIIFNCILWWAQEGFQTSLEELAIRMTEITDGLYNADIAKRYEEGRKIP